MARYIANVPAMLPAALLKAVANSTSPRALRTIAAEALFTLATTFMTAVASEQLESIRKPNPGQPALLTANIFMSE